MAKTGRPLKYETEQELQDVIDTYFIEKCKTEYVKDDEGNLIYNSNGKPLVIYNPPTISGLALHLGFEDRRSLYDYKERAQFSYTIKRAITSIEEYYEKQLVNGQPTGSIFWLKNHGWVDKQVTENTTTGIQKVFITKEQEEKTDEHIESFINGQGISGG